MPLRPTSRWPLCSSTPAACGALLAAVTLAPSLPGCDPQAGVDYLGQPLIRVTGSVELGPERPDGTLVPALAFMGDGSAVHFVDVQAEGGFPAEFDIAVFEPPPDEAFSEISKHFPDEPPVAGGYITAVVEDHPSSIRLGQHQGGVGTISPEGSVFMESWCTPDLSECYEEIKTCPAEFSDDSECTIERNGDPQLAEDAFEQFAGFSENYRIVYLKEPARPGSYTAYVANAPDGLDAGYHLFELSELDAEELAEQEACEQEARALAVERYNDEHDTDYSIEDLEHAGSSCRVSRIPDCVDGAACEGVEPEPLPECVELPIEAYGEFEALVERAKMDLSCLASPQRVERVADPANEPIDVRIGATLRPAPSEPMVSGASAGVAGAGAPPAP